MILNLPKLGLVRFDDNLTNEELSQQLTALSQKYGFQFDQPERGLGTLLGHGIMRGTKQLGSALADVLPAMGASALGFEDYAKKKMQEAAETQAEIERKYPAQFKSYTEIGSPYEALQYGAETLGELAPTALGAMIPGGIAGGIGRAAATRGAMAAAESVGTLSLAGREAAQVAAKKAGEEAGKTAMYGGLFLGSFAQNAPEVFENIYEKTNKLEPLVAGLAGGVSALLDSVVPARVLTRFGEFGKKKIAENLIKESGAAPSVWKAIGKEAAISAASEGLTESAQEAISVAAEQYAGSLKGLLDPENIQRYKESFVKGAVGGAGFGVIGGYGQGRAEKQAYLEDQAKKGAPPVVPPTGEVTPPAPAPTAASLTTDEEAALAKFGEEIGKLAQTQVEEGAAPPTGPTTSVDEIVGQGKAKEVFGLGRSAKIFREPPSVDESGNIIGGIAGLDLANPEHAPQLRAILTREAEKTKVEGAATKLEGLIEKLPAVPQPSEGVPTDVTGLDTTTGGAGVEVPIGRGAGAAPIPVEPSKPSGVDVAPVDVGQPVGGEVAQPGALAPEVQRAVEFVQSVEAGGIPLNPAKIRTIAESLGLEVKKSARPEETIQRIREAVGRASQQPFAVETQEATPAPAPTATVTPLPPAKLSPEIRKAVSSIDKDVDSLLSNRTAELLKSEGERPDTFQIESFKGTAVHDALRIPRLFSQYITLSQRLGTNKEGSARQQMAEIRNVVTQIDPNAAEVFDELPKLGGRQDEFLGRLNRDALQQFDAVLNQSIQEVKQARVAAVNRQFEDQADALVDYVFGKNTVDAKPSEPLPLDKAIGKDFTSEQRGLAQAGNLKGLLQSLYEQATDPDAKLILRRMLAMAVDTKLVVGETVDNKPGAFDPATNTITINPETGMNPHTFVHEVSHSVLSHTLDNPSHPVTKEVTNLYNQMKDSSEGAYGATNVQEFAAEAWGNEDFRNHLKQFKPTGEKLNGWERLINSVRRLFGFKPSYETAYDKLDRLLNDIISPAPESRAGEPLFAASMRVPDAAGKIYTAVDNGLKKLPSLMTPERRTAFWKSLEKLAVPLRSGIYKLLTASQLGEVGQKYFGENSVKFARLLNEMEGFKEVLREKLEPLHDRHTKHRNQNPERHAMLHKLITDATLEDVAPYPEMEAKYKKTDKAPVWANLHGRFLELTPEEQKLYRDHFNTFAALREEFKKSLAQNIKETIPERERALSVYNKIVRELAEVMIEHYSPLYRQGDYRLAYNINSVPTVERFTTQAERAAAQERLAAQGATDFEATSEIDQFTARTVPDNTMLSSIMKIMKDAGAQEADLDKLVQLVVSAFPETSMLKRMQKRTGISGYVDNNAALVFDRVVSGTVRQIANTRYRQQIRQTLNDMEADQKKLRGDDSEDAKTMYNDFNGRFEYSLNPNISGWAQFTSSSAFYYNLGANVSSAVVQLATVPTVVLPMIGGKYGWGASWGALKNAINLFSQSGMSREVTEMTGEKSVQKAMLSVENLTNAGVKDAAKYKDLIDALKMHGLLTNSTARDALRSENQNDSGFGSTNKLQRTVSLWSSFLFHHTERMSREITALATYDLEMAKLTKDKPNMLESERQARAIQEAIRVTERTHGASSTVTGPSLGQSDLGKVLMVFKRFALAQYYNLFSTIFRAFPVKGASEDVLEDIRAARRQLVGIYGMAAVFAGAKGIPLYWIAALAYNSLRDDDDDDFDALMRRYLGELVYKGPVNYLTNLSIADRIGWNDLIWRENKNDRADSSAVTQHVEALLGAPFSILKNFEKGFKQISEGNFYRGVETMLPSAIKNVMKGARYGYEGANTLRGDPVMGDINGYNAAMQALGFAPADLMRQYEENAYILGKQKTITGKEQQLLKQYYVAYRQNDFDRANELREKLFELGDKYPELGINEAMLNKSVKARDRITDKLYHGVQLNEKLRARLEGARSMVYD